ncbi:MAG: hypothetical protein JST05_06750 [Acidobacteria bacterium]|nr:hypothetical protein [Acidobacteriota bacterium]
MPLPMPAPPQSKPAQVISQIAIPRKSVPLAQAEASLLAALDSGLAPKGESGLAPKDRAAYQWLLSAATWQPGAALAIPFPRGAQAREAAAWSAFLAKDEGDPTALPLTLSGSRLLLWSWMRERDRHAPLPKATRAAVEDRLLEGGPDTLRGWALRHALCFAVAEKDLTRFTALKANRMDMAPDTFTSSQSLFALLDGPSPAFRLWRLPDLAYDDTPLGSLGARSVWICPPGIPVPQGAAWIIPSATGGQNGREADLDPGMKAEARALLPELHGRAAWFAASKETFESYGLQWFPILIELDEDGNLRSVKMGDAAP